MICRALNSLWCAGYRGKERRFREALREPEAAQQRVLSRVLARNRNTVFGRRHRLDPAWDVRTFQRRVPLGNYASHEADIDAIRQGKPGVLTADRVTHLIPTSGSAGARKLIPYTHALKQSFDAALAPWVRSLFRAYPAAAKGRAYWSISPAIAQDRDAAVPIGFEDDTAYLGPLGRVWVGRLLAVPSSVRHLTDVSAFRRATLVHLLRARDLSLISVWHPSFLTLLLDEMAQQWPALLRCLPASRARELSRVSPTDIRGIWPRLAVVSAWADAAAALPCERLRQRLGGVAVQPKGLLASECWTTIPYHGAFPLALTAHFFEFLDAQQCARSVSEVQVDGTYELVVTTAGGLYRYRTGDRVRITGCLDATPTLRFLGRDADTSDTCGEKLHESHALDAITAACEQSGYHPHAVVLGPEADHAPTRYTLALTGPAEPPERLAAALDAALRANPHYDLCRRLDQLQPPAVIYLGRAETIRVAPDVAPDGASGLAPATTPLGAYKPPVLLDSEALRAVIAPTSTGGRGERGGCL